MENKLELPKTTQLEDKSTIDRNIVINTLRTDPYGAGSRMYSQWCDQESAMITKQIQESNESNLWENYTWDRIQVLVEGNCFAEALHELDDFNQHLLRLNRNDEWVEKCEQERKRIIQMNVG